MFKKFWNWLIGKKREPRPTDLSPEMIETLYRNTPLTSLVDHKKPLPVRTGNEIKFFTQTGQLGSTANPLIDEYVDYLNFSDMLHDRPIKKRAKKKTTKKKAAKKPAKKGKK